MPRTYPSVFDEDSDGKESLDSFLSLLDLTYYKRSFEFSMSIVLHGRMIWEGLFVRLNGLLVQAELRILDALQPVTLLLELLRR